MHILEGFKLLLEYYNFILLLQLYTFTYGWRDIDHVYYTAVLVLK